MPDEYLRAYFVTSRATINILNLDFEYNLLQTERKKITKLHLDMMGCTIPKEIINM